MYRLVLPYLDRCVLHASILNSRAEAYADMLDGDRGYAEMALHNPQLVKGIAASLRTLIIASFRAPATQFVVSLLRRLNPTAQMLRAAAFCRHNEYVFALLCLLNVNMGALDLSRSGGEGDDGSASGFGFGGDAQGMGEDSHYNAHALLHELASVYSDMDAAAQARVYKRVMSSGALPISRDTPSYVAVMSVLHGGAAWSQLDYVTGRGGKEDEDDENYLDTRNEAKVAHASRMAALGAQNLRQGERHEQGQRIVAEDKGSFQEFGVASLTGQGGVDAKAHSQQLQAQANIQAQAKPVPSAAPRVVGDNTPMRADSKTARTTVARGPERESKDRDGAGLRLLGDLPGLVRDRTQHLQDVRVALSLELPGEGRGAEAVGTGAVIPNSGTSAQPKQFVCVDDGIPLEYKCAINGHVMKEPVRCASSGLVFERATIELWLDTRGSVCPITNRPLDRADLEPAGDLKNRIKRFHITQTSMRIAAKQEDDLYDF